MRVFLGSITLLLTLYGALALAQDNPAAGSWRLNTAKSSISGPLPAAVHNGILKINREIFTGTSSPRTPRASGQPARQPVFKFDLSPDGQTLTLTRPGSDPNLKIVFDRQ